MAKLLLDENPLVIQPSLAAAIGLNEAIVVQQLHYWLNKTDFVKDGRKWVYNTMADWHKQLFFWSLKTVDRTFKNLIQTGIVLVANYNRSKVDKTLWYSIDYDVLTNLVDDYLCNVSSDEEIADCLSETYKNETEFPSGQNDQIEDTKMYVPFSQNDQSIWSSCLIHLDNLGGPIPETTTEITTETNSQSVCQSARKDETDRLNDGTPTHSISDQQPAVNDFADRNIKQADINCISKIINNCSLEVYFDKDMANAIAMALQNLYFNGEFARNNLKLPLEVVRERMKKLNGEMIEFAVQKMQRAAAYGTKIGNPTNYLQSCIFNAISEYTTSLLSDEYLSRLALDGNNRNMFGSMPEKSLEYGTSISKSQGG
ncbi:MAG: hypothetical protein ACM3TR_01030 [Caulobacteraceae bacterium]